VSSAIRRNENGERVETVDTLKWDELLLEDWDTLAEIVNVLGGPELAITFTKSKTP